ncbi:MAG: aryl-sulfate sulfotransferase [Clostridiales Family XIII bacterium]|nr:aryl-sulfate sulfotransferase [Clostridiales Family XIII bacterium]
MGHPSVYPTGVTVYDVKRAWNGYTVFPSVRGALLIDMNGNEVNRWAGLGGFPNKILPGGYVLGNTGSRKGSRAYQDQLDLIQADWDGNVVWTFDHTELVSDGDNKDGNKEQWQARQHHDYQREGSPTGYYAPGQAPETLSGNTLILVHENVKNPDISEHELIDDKVIEVTWDGDIIWEWKASDHFGEFGFSDAAKAVLRENPGIVGEAGGDWMHINSLSAVGANKHYDAGDERFHPDNLIMDARNSNILFIVSKKTGEIVWRLGPDFDTDESVKKIGWIIGQHHFHLIPKGLPGEGDFLVFDNGGAGGYGAPNPASLDGRNNAVRDYSRVLQFDPLTLEIKWQYTPLEAGNILFTDASKFYSSYISSAQRLPNGNTLITEGSDGRLIEVTEEHEIVWEYINPYYYDIGGKFHMNMIYRAYRVPYDWVPVPESERNEEIAIAPVDVSAWRLPGASAGEGTGKVTAVNGADPNRRCLVGMSDPSEEKGGGKSADFCMVRITLDE